MQIIINHKRDEAGAVWEKLPVPDELTKRIDLMKTLAGTQTIITLTHDRMTCYLCGTEDIRAAKQKQMGDKGLTRICMDLEEAHRMVEYEPFTFVYALQIFSTEADKEKLFPPPPVVYDKGWEHLRPEEEK
jgi:hypothetical protein